MIHMKARAQIPSQQNMFGDCRPEEMNVNREIN